MSDIIKGYNKWQHDDIQRLQEIRKRIEARNNIGIIIATLLCVGLFVTYFILS